MSTSMRAIRIHHYGPPSVLTFEAAPRPVLRAGEVLVAVKAAGIQPVDREIRNGDHPDWGYTFPYTPGTDVAGIVAEVGPQVEHVRVGDAVWGQADSTRGGSYAEFAVAPASCVAPKPRSLSFEEAASAAVAAATARQVLVDIARLQPGQRVLAIGAGGAVGGYVVQIAKVHGAYVAATGSGPDLDYVLALGADEVIDHQAQRFEDVARGMDVVFDPLGGESWRAALQTLKPGGICVLSDYVPTDTDKAEARARQAKLEFVGVVVTSTVLDELAELFDGGFLKPRIGAVMPLAEAAAAHALGASPEHPRGHIVLAVAP